MEHIKPPNDGQFTTSHVHEESDVNVKAIFGFGAFLVVSGIILHVGMWFFYRGLDKAFEFRNEQTQPMVRQTTSGLDQARISSMKGETHKDATQRLIATFPEPRLQDDDARDMAAMRQNENKMLNSYSWLDEKAGRVRIPIARAMELAAARGIASNAAQPNPAETVRWEKASVASTGIIPRATTTPGGPLDASGENQPAKTSAEGDSQKKPLAAKPATKPATPAAKKKQPETR